MTRNEALLAVGAVLGSLLIGEAAARWLLPVQYRKTLSHRPKTGAAFWPPIHAYDPEIGWVLTPASVISHISVLPNARFSVSHGERLTSPHPHPGPRIVATGCSFTFGHGITDEDSWPWLLQERLPDDHVVNVAASGYGTDQALLAAQRQVERFPGEVATVVLGFADFQIERNRCPQSFLEQIYPSRRPQYVQSGASVVNKGLIGFWSLGGFVDTIADNSVLLSRALSMAADRVVNRIPDHTGARQLTTALILDFARRFQARGVKLVVVVLPYLDDQSSVSKADRGFVTDRLRSKGIPVLALDLPRRADGTIDPRQFAVGFHPNRRYNVALANQLAQFLGATEPRVSDTVRER
jgi:hypothetical protein